MRSATAWVEKNFNESLKKDWCEIFRSMLIFFKWPKATKHSWNFHPSICWKVKGEKMRNEPLKDYSRISSKKFYLLWKEKNYLRKLHWIWKKFLKYSTKHFRWHVKTFCKSVFRKKFCLKNSIIKNMDSFFIKCNKFFDTFSTHPVFSSKRRFLFYNTYW